MFFCLKFSVRPIAAPAPGGRCPAGGHSALRPAAGGPGPATAGPPAPGGPGRRRAKGPGPPGRRPARPGRRGRGGGGQLLPQPHAQRQLPRRAGQVAPVPAQVPQPEELVRQCLRGLILSGGQRLEAGQGLLQKPPLGGLVALLAGPAGPAGQRVGPGPGLLLRKGAGHREAPAAKAPEDPLHCKGLDGGKVQPAGVHRPGPGRHRQGDVGHRDVPGQGGQPPGPGCPGERAKRSRKSWPAGSRT